MTQVGALSRALAIRTLQLELEYIYGCLEDEALDIGQGTQNPSFLLSRQVRPLFVVDYHAGCMHACTQKSLFLAAYVGGRFASAWSLRGKWVCMHACLSCARGLAYIKRPKVVTACDSDTYFD